MQNINNLVKNIKNLKSKSHTLLIGIDGMGGSGKTTLALELKKYFPEVKIVTTDDFLNHKIHRIDWQWLNRDILKPLSNNKSARYIQFLGKENIKRERIIEPGGIVIIEGEYAIHSNIANTYDYKIWLDISVETANERATSRDGYFDKKWDKYYRPTMIKYIQEDKPIERADFVITN